MASAAVAPHSLLRATVLSSVVGLVAGLSVGLIVLAPRRDRD